MIEITKLRKGTDNFTFHYNFLTMAMEDFSNLPSMGLDDPFITPKDMVLNQNNKAVGAGNINDSGSAVHGFFTNIDDEKLCYFVWGSYRKHVKIERELVKWWNVYYKPIEYIREKFSMVDRIDTTIWPVHIKDTFNLQIFEIMKFEYQNAYESTYSDIPAGEDNPYPISAIPSALLRDPDTRKRLKRYLKRNLLRNEIFNADCFFYKFWTRRYNLKLTDDEPRRYRTMEAASMKLQKEAKGYLDSLRGWLFHANFKSLLTNPSHDRFSNAYS